MKVLPVIIGAILALAGIAAAVVGGMFVEMGRACANLPDCDPGAFTPAFWGAGVLYGGALLTLVGAALLAAGVVARSAAAGAEARA